MSLFFIVEFAIALGERYSSDDVFAELHRSGAR